MYDFIYSIPTKIYFGDKLNLLGEELKKYGNKVLLTYGGGSIKKIGLYDRIIKELNRNDFEVYELSGIEPNPRITSVRNGVKICKDKNIDVILAVGGGSTIDASKWISAGAKVDFDPWEFFSDGRPLNGALPLVSVLTLSATGSEMDAGGVISNLETGDKIGRVDPILYPKASFLDPTVTYSVGNYATACGSADIFSHLLEVYFDTKEWFYMVDTFNEGMMRTVVKYAPIALKEPENYEARANLMWTSSWAINGFIRAGRGQSWSCHPMEHELSAKYDITHGLGLAIITPKWMKYCLNEKTLPRYVSLGINVFGIDGTLPEYEIAENAIKETEKFLYRDLGLEDSFAKVGIKSEDIPAMAEKICKNGALDGFIPLEAEDVENIFNMCV